MTQPERVSVADLRRVAELANLELTAPEELSMLRDLNSILDHVAQLNELDTSSVPAMAQVSEILAGEQSVDRQGKPVGQSAGLVPLHHAGQPG